MYTQTMVSFNTFGPYGPEPDEGLDLFRIDEYAGSFPTQRDLFRDEIKRLESGEPLTVASWAEFDRVEMIENLKRADLGWQKLVDPSMRLGPWNWADLEDGIFACRVACNLYAATRETLAASLPDDGPVNRFGLELCDRYVEIQRILAETVIPTLELGMSEIRSRMGQVDLTMGEEVECMTCGTEIDGSKGFIVLDAPRRPKGVRCLTCFGH
jgi:hypothetical protein